MAFNFFPFIGALLVTFAITPIVKSISICLKIIDQPNARKIHRDPIPLLGGVAVYLGLIVGILLSGLNIFTSKEFLIIYSAGTMLLIVGILDDWGILHPQIKLMIAMPVAGLGLIYFDQGLKIIHINFINYFFTLFWIVGITAAYNLLDGMDGLSTGICIIASIFYLIVGTIAKDNFLTCISLSLIGACLGFIFYNFHPAKIFLGDGGAIFLGFILASMGLRVANHESLPINTRWMLPILILLVPIFDTSLITISRMRRGMIPFLHPGKDHFHHRLFNMGLGQRKTVLLIYLIGIVGGFLSIFIYYLSCFTAYFIFSVLILLGGWFIYLCEKFPYERQELISRHSPL